MDSIGASEYGLVNPPITPTKVLCVVFLQVKEGTERRGALQSVFRLIRKEVGLFNKLSIRNLIVNTNYKLLSANPPLTLPPNRKVRQQDGDGWRMVDAGDFAVHIVSRAARERFFASDHHQERIW